MGNHYETIYPSGVQPVEISKEEARDYTGKVLDYADKYMPAHIGESYVLHQEVDGDYFAIDLYHITVRRSLTVDYRLHAPQLFLICTDSGSIHLTKQSGQYLTQTGENHYYLSHQRSGHFSAIVGVGTPRLWVFSLQAHLVAHNTPSLPNLLSMLRGFLLGEVPFGYNDRDKIAAFQRHARQITFPRNKHPYCPSRVVLRLFNSQSLPFLSFRAYPGIAKL